MFRTFLSWRYLLARRTNLIGVVGIFVAVWALILILSIMTGFLEESRRAVRGSLSDVLVEPFPERRREGAGAPRPGPLLDIARAHPRVQAATAQLQWGGILTESGGEAQRMKRILSSSSVGGLLAVQFVGIDVRNLERLSMPLLIAAYAHAGIYLPPWHVQDELDVTAFQESIGAPEGASESFKGVNALFPFLPPVQRIAGRPKASVLVGRQLAGQLGLKRGKTIQLNTGVFDPFTNEVVPSNREFVVAGTFRSGENATDLGRVYLERSELADFLGDSLNFSQILVRTVDFARDGPLVRDDLSAAYEKSGLISGGMMRRIEVRTWRELRANLVGAIENERVLMAIMLSLVLVVAGFTVFAILSMMVTEKRRDIGILAALGATPGGIMQVFLFIAFWDAMIGAVTGCLFGIWSARNIDGIERWLSSTFNIQIFNRDVYLFDRIPSIVDPIAVAAIVLGAFFCALTFAVVPAWRAARLDPLAALRYE